MLKDTLRLGSDISDIDGQRTTAHIWIHPDGGVYVRYSYRYSVPGYKLTDKKIIDYWGLQWYMIIPANTIPVNEVVWS